MFLLCHHDDEFGVFYLIKKYLDEKKDVHIVYLTSSNKFGKQSVVRETESLKVLSSLGVKLENIHYIGKKNKVKDLKLHNYMRVIHTDLLKLCIEKKINLIFTHSWEGGHPDHDTANVIGANIGKSLKLLNKTYQFPLYSGRRLFWWFFRLFDAYPENGCVIRYKVPFQERIRFIILIFFYKSQIKTFIGLFPFYLIHMVFSGEQIIQPINLKKFSKRPHSGKLLYERRQMGNFDIIKKNYLKYINWVN
ncbi:PIG-L family deacetylase [Alphaproteobacteria bacterium]|nr:PIG-L family deacetylase [Alphaproteobacteria bacterium]